MPKLLAIVIELAISVGALWLLACLSTLAHEAGHAFGYVLATGNTHWHIRVGWGKRLLHTERLSVNLLPFDGRFTPSNKEFDTKAKLIMTLLGGPAFSFLLVAGLMALKFSGLSLQSDFFADGAIEFFLNTALSINLYNLALSLSPIHYFYGETKGLESDGLQILRLLKTER